MSADRLKFIRPQEPRLVLEPPVSDDWLHEIKYDGFRVQLILDWAGARAFTRNGHDWSKRFWPVVNAGEKLPAKSFIIDGEMIAPEADGRPNFHQMHSRMTWNAELLAFVAFDILHLDGRICARCRRSSARRCCGTWSNRPPASSSTASMSRAAAPISSPPSTG
jgi:bifunctional non-homologous end joining protein LigD